MKKLFTILLFLSANIMFAQMEPPEGRPPEPPDRRDFGRRFEELENIKLLEILDLDEDMAIKFFARRNKSRDTVHEIMKEKDELLKKIESSLKNNETSNYKKLYQSLLDNEVKMHKERRRFLTSLDDILTTEQIVKVMLFEHKFREDVKDLLIERGRKKFMGEKKDFFDKDNN